MFILVLDFAVRWLPSLPPDGSSSAPHALLLLVSCSRYLISSTMSLSGDLLKLNRARKAKLMGNVLEITFPKSKKKLVKPLGGFLRPTKSSDSSLLSGQLLFKTREDADKALASELPDGVTLKRKGLESCEVDTLSLKVTGIPDAATADDVSALFPNASAVILKDKKRNDFLFRSDKEFRHLFGKEAVVRFESSDECAACFTKGQDAEIMGHSVTVTFGQKNHKIKKKKRRKQRTIKKEF